MNEKVFGVEAEQQFVAAINEMVSTDIWQNHFANEVKITEIQNAPIAVKSVMADNGIEDELEDATRLAMETTMAVAKVPHSNGYKTYPVNIEAFPSLQDRAGLYGRTVKQVSEVLNVGLEINEDKAQALVRGGMLCADHSGKYVVLEQNRLIDIFTDEVRKLNLKERFVYGRISTSFTEAVYTVETQKKPKVSRGMNAKFAVRFTTSDTSKSGANVGCGLVFRENGRQYILPFGKAVKLKHDGDANFTQFRQNCTLLLSLLREQEQKLAELEKRVIKHPQEAFENLVIMQNLPRKEAKVVLEDFLIRAGAGCTALDVFLNLGNIVGAVQQNKGAYEKVLDIQENIARIAFFDNAMWNKIDAPHSLL